MLSVGDRLPDATFLTNGPNGPEAIALRELTKNKTLVIFALPGAFTPTCDSAHMPGFIRNADAIRARGVDAILCISVNDAHVMRYWGETTGATAAGIILLSDPQAAFTKTVGMTYSNPAAGMFDRSRRYAMKVEDGVVTTLNLDQPGVCDLSTAETMLADL